MSGTQAVALIVRFDRPRAGGRIPYLSAASLRQLGSREDGAYTQIAEAIDLADRAAEHLTPQKPTAARWQPS